MFDPTSIADLSIGQKFDMEFPCIGELAMLAQSKQPVEKESVAYHRYCEEKYSLSGILSLIKVPKGRVFICTMLTMT